MCGLQILKAQTTTRLAVRQKYMQAEEVACSISAPENPAKDRTDCIAEHMQRKRHHEHHLPAIDPRQSIRLDCGQVMG